MKKKKPINKTEKVLPTPEFLDKVDVIEEDTERAGQKRMRVTNQRWLDIYLKKDVITYEHFMAASRLYSIWSAAGFRQSVTIKYDPLLVGYSSSDMSERQSACIADYNKIADKMGKITFSILRAVVIENYSASDWARYNKRAKKAAPEFFRIALDELVDVFKNFKS